MNIKKDNNRALLLIILFCILTIVIAFTSGVKKLASVIIFVDICLLIYVIFNLFRKGFI